MNETSVVVMAPTPTALVIIDVQKGFDDPVWGLRNNPAAEGNIAALLERWRADKGPVVAVRHDSTKDGSPLAPNQPGNEFATLLDNFEPDLVFGKTVNSAFHGEVDLHDWLGERGIDAIVLAGIQTNMCVETTARVGGNLGHEVTVALDATYTFDLAGPDGAVLTADELSVATATNLHGGGFAVIRTTGEILADR